MRIDPDAAHQARPDVRRRSSQAVEKNNLNVGGGNIRQDGEMLLVHGLGRTTNVEQIENIVVTAKDGVPIRVARRGRRGRSATRSAAAPSPPTARAKSCWAWASC